ncbi:hypothetical protein F7187_01800 [Helicobacter pylori]|nr:hypothetical protein [Helicobacter pylori]
MFLKSVRILNFFHYAIFGSVLLKLLFLKTGFWLLCFVVLKLILKIFQILFIRGIGGILK